MPSCSNCAAEATTRCGRCKVTRYCSRDCQRAHWPAHKSECGSSQPAAGAAEAPTLPAEDCSHCGQPGARARCVKCKEAVYCGVDCQRAAWRDHKGVCGKIPGGAEALQMLQRASGLIDSEPQAALAMADQARQVLTRERDAMKWALASRTMAQALFRISRGQRSEEQREAVLAQCLECFEEALEEFSPETDPVAWADTLDNMGTALATKRTGSKAGNREAAIQCWKDALRITTKRRPDIWGEAYTNLGLALLLRASEGGERVQSLEDAIVALEKSLTVFSREEKPGRFARSSSTLGRAYAMRVEGDRRENLEKAQMHLEAARAIMGGRQGGGAADIACNLADVMLAQMDDVRALNLFEEAKELSPAFTARADIGIARLGMGNVPENVDRASLPKLWAEAQELLGDKAQAAGDWGEAASFYGAARSVKSAAAFPADCISLSAKLLQCEVRGMEGRLEAQAASRANLPEDTRTAMAESDERLWADLIASARSEALVSLANAAAVGVPSTDAARLAHTAYEHIVTLVAAHGSLSDLSDLLEEARCAAARLSLLRGGSKKVDKAWQVLHRVAHESLADQSGVGPRADTLAAARHELQQQNVNKLLRGPCPSPAAASSEPRVVFWGCSCLVQLPGGELRWCEAPEGADQELGAIIGSHLLGNPLELDRLRALLNVDAWAGEWLQGVRRLLVMPHGPTWGVPFDQLLPPGVEIHYAASLCSQAYLHDLSALDPIPVADHYLYCAHDPAPLPLSEGSLASRAFVSAGGASGESELGGKQRTSKVTCERLLDSAKLRGATMAVFVCGEGSSGLKIGADVVPLHRIACELELEECVLAVVSGTAVEAGQAATALIAAGAQVVAVLGTPCDESSGAAEVRRLLTARLVDVVTRGGAPQEALAATREELRAFGSGLDSSASSSSPEEGAQWPLTHLFIA